MNPLFQLLLLVFLGFIPTIFAAEKNDPSIYTGQKTNIIVTTTQPQFVIQLKSNPSTGFSWFLKKHDSRFIQPVKHYFQASDKPKLIGAPGYELWVFKVKTEAFTVPVQTPMSFVYARPWEKTNPAAELTFWVSTRK